MKPSIQAFANNDDAVVVWQSNEKIKDCYGFALYRKLKGESDTAAEPVQSYVGFEDQTPKEGEHRSSTEWPIQKFVWTDFFVKTGDAASYKVIPMIWNGNHLVKDETKASDWSNEIVIETGKVFKASFNRGLVSSQFLINKMQNVPEKDRSKNLDQVLADETSKTRAFLGGNLSFNIYRLLDNVFNDETLVIYAALYELNEPTLVGKLKKLKKRANVILANGAFKATEPDPNKDARAALKDIISLLDRMVTGSHFAHNKFLVVCKKVGEEIKPIRVLTGSTNWSKNGMFAQINNGVIIEDEIVAEYYFEEWKRIKEAGNDYPKTFSLQNSTPSENPAIGIKTWFTSVNDFVDMVEARALINNAKQGILFLMFNPGVKNTLFNAILDKNAADTNLFVHGIINQDPGTKENPLIFVNRGKQEPTDFNAIIPKNIKLGNRFSRKEIAGKMVVIHSKVILIDPFSENPILMTGSHNLGEKASKSNDDNLNIIRGNKKLAEEYAVHIMSVYNHYRYRYFQFLNQDNTTTWNGLKYTDTWQESYLTGLKKREIAFWLGK
ncbi:MAG: phospholipase D-like domain-containing protein [Bacteroidota bacterium]